MPTLTISSPTDGTSVTPGQPLTVSGQARDRGGAEPVLIESVTVQVDGGPATRATLTRLRDRTDTVADFSAAVQVTGAEGAHTITVAATNDEGISATTSVTVFLGPSFDIDAPVVRLEVDLPFTVGADDSFVTSLLSRVQQGLTGVSGVLAAKGKIVAGPNAVASATATGTLLRIGLWIEDAGFTVQPPEPPQFPLPRLSDTAAQAGFALAAPLPLPRRTGFADLPFAVFVARTALQELADAALAASHNGDVDSITVSVSPPATVTTEYHGTVVDHIVPYTITITETLGVAIVPGSSPPVSAPVVGASHSSSVGDLPDWLIGTLTVILDLGLLMVWQDVSRAADSTVSADGTGGVASPIVADMPVRVPFHNTALPAAGIGGDFPVLVADWASTGVTADGILGTADATIQARDQGMVGLTIDGPDYVRVPPGEPIANQVYAIVLANLAPDQGAFTWQLWSSIDDTMRTGAVELGSFAQVAYLDLDFRMPPHLSPGTYRYVLTVAATETCGTDSAKTLTASASKDIEVNKPAPVAHPGQPGQPGQPR